MQYLEANERGGGEITIVFSIYHLAPLPQQCLICHYEFVFFMQSSGHLHRAGVACVTGLPSPLRGLPPPASRSLPLLTCPGPCICTAAATLCCFCLLPPWGFHSRVISSRPSTGSSTTLPRWGALRRGLVSVCGPIPSGRYCMVSTSLSIWHLSLVAHVSNL